VLIKKIHPNDPEAVPVMTMKLAATIFFPNSAAWS